MPMTAGARVEGMGVGAGTPTIARICGETVAGGAGSTAGAAAACWGGAAGAGGVEVGVSRTLASSVCIATTA
jgi:hypothetical protein